MGSKPEQVSKNWRSPSYARFIKAQLRRRRRRLFKSKGPSAPTRKLTKGWEH